MKKTLLAATMLVGLSTTACTTYGDGVAAAPAAPTLGNAAAPGEVDPAIWKLSDDDTTIYMLGTFHLLPEDYQWRTDTIEAALAESDEIYFEIEDDLRDPAAIAPLIQSLAIDPSQPSLAERFGDEDAAKIIAMTEGSGIPAQALNIMDSWFIGLTLANVIATKAGVAEGAGVEVELREDVDARNLPVKGLETAEEQLTYLDTMSAEAQRTFVASGLDEDETDMVQMFQDMMDAWVRGDTDAIAATFNDELDIGTEIRSAILTRRNEDWTGDIIARMAEPGTVFIAVGAGHLVGPDSVVAMLQQRGYTATRIDD